MTTPKEALELKPCPFCNSRCVTTTQNASNWPIVQCDDCGACGPCIDLDDEYIIRWNTRATASLEGEAVERVARIRLIASKCFDPTGFEIDGTPIYAVAEWKAAEGTLDAILATGLVAGEAGGTAQQSDDAFDIEETRRENAENVLTLDAIADYVGCPHDEELTVDHVRQHYMRLENAAQQRGIKDAGRIANAQAYSAEREAAIRADEREKHLDSACESLLVFADGYRKEIDGGAIGIALSNAAFLVFGKERVRRIAAAIRSGGAK